MPSLTKMSYFFASASLTAISVGLLGFAMSTTWSTTTMDCSGFYTNNGSAAVTLGLFNGKLVRESCPSFGSENTFPVVSALSEISKAPVKLKAPSILHCLCLSSSVSCLVCSASSILISLYNSVSNPYQTYMGPIGVYACSSIGACFSVLVLIIFVSNINVTEMAEESVPSVGEVSSPESTNKRSEMKVGYFSLIPYAVLSSSAILLIYSYDHAAYTHRREQERPTEDAPKEIMMY